MTKSLIVNLKSHDVHVVDSTDARINDKQYYVLYSSNDLQDVEHFAHTMKMAYAYNISDRKNTFVA